MAETEKVVGMIREDDKVEPVISDWYENVVRIGTLADGSCFYHSFLKSFYDHYQKAPKEERFKIVKELRKELSDVLEKKIGNSTIYEQIGNGLFLDYENQKVPIVKDMVFNLENLKKILNSYEYLGEEILLLTVELFSINIHIVIPTDKNLYYYHSYTSEGNKYAIVIANVGNCHYETIGLEYSDGIKTLFFENDHFITKIKSAPRKTT